MDQSEEKRKGYVKRLLFSRMRVLCTNGFYGLLLMHIKYGLDETCPTAYTNGNIICFNPQFLEGLTDSELDLVMMHEILHVVLLHCFRGKEYDSYAFNIACDIVVNSNILYSKGMDLKSITLDGEPLMHVTPKGDEGYKYTAEEVYEMLPKMPKKNLYGETFDDHGKWGEDGELADLWAEHFRDALKIFENQNGVSWGDIPMFAQRVLKELKAPQTDWRTILNEFVQEEIADYSFTPPDRRFEGDFLLPDFSDTDATVRDILFMVDTSGSMSDDEVSAAFSEVKGAIEQFNGKLKGWLGYFDAAVVEPQPFEDVGDLIKPVGGGGTSFGVIFSYVERFMQANPPACIIILTDGFADFPKKNKLGIPVLWLINNNAVNPPWGKTARMKA